MHTRTPNTRCLICEKPLYRRPYEFDKVRYFACRAHRSDAQMLVGITAKQEVGLSLGREKGTNHRTGYQHRAESKRKVSASNKAFWALHPDKASLRGEKCRGAKHYKWKGGSAKLNISIRQMSENRKWMIAVKARDGCCTECGGREKLESHHIRPLVELIEILEVRSREDARKHADTLWDVSNGVTLCQKCHYRQHGRKYCDDTRTDVH